MNNSHVSLSVIVITLNEERNLPCLLSDLAQHQNPPYSDLLR